MKKLLITHCSVLGASETFIRAHIEKLPFETHFVQELPPRIIDLSSYTPGAGKAVDALQDFSSEYGTILDKIEPDAVLAEYGPSGVAVMNACKARNIPLITHFHGFDASMTVVLERYGAAYKELFEYASSIICVSERMREKLLELGAAPNKLVLNHYGSDINTFNPGEPSLSSTFIFVGRLVPKKDPTSLIRAFAVTARLRSDVKLHLLGEGDLRNECEHLIETLILSSRVRLLGAVPHEEVASALRSARALVMPSTKAENGDEEGLPNCVLEAMACGLPVIGTRHAGIPDAVLHEKTGLLVDPEDTAALSQAMTRIAESDELTDSLGSAGRSRAEEHFSQRESLEKLAEIIDQV